MALPYGRMRRNTALACAPVSAAVLLGVLLLAPATASAQTIFGVGQMPCTEGESVVGKLGLNQRPSEAITLALDVGDTTIATVTPESVTIGPDNWNHLPDQEFTAHCVDNDVLDPYNPEDSYGARFTELTVSASSASESSVYDGVTRTGYVITYDNENRVATLTEGGTYERKFYVVFQVEEDISITATSSDTSVISVSPATHAFKYPDESRKVKVWTLTAVDDGVYRGEKKATVSFSRPPNWAYFQQGVEVTVTDNDTPALVLAPDPLNVPEDGSTTYTVKLATEPTDSVTVAIAGTGDADLTLDETSLTFTTSNWNAVQTVTVSAADDENAVSETATLTHTASGGLYDSATADLGVTVNDNDTPALVIVPESLSVDEGDDATYTVKLASEPTAAVTVAITGQADTDLTLDETSLTFTTSNWNAVQTVTVSAADDENAVSETATLTHDASGGDYDSISTTLPVTTRDNDGRGFNGGALSDATLTVAEGGSSDHEIRLSTLPTDTVTVTISGHADTDLMLDTASFTFTTSNWNTAQTVEVSADEDDDAVNDEVTLTLTGAGGDYEGETAQLVVTVTDNDMEGLTFEPAEIEVNESGSDTSKSYTVKLATEPSADVTVAITKPAGSDLTLGARSLTFTTSNWNTVQTVTVTAGVDADAEDDIDELTHNASGGGYDAVSGTVTVTVSDTNTRGLTLRPTTVAVDEGDSASYTVKLNTQPTGPVTVAITGHASTDLILTPSSGSLTFTTANWNTVQTVTVAAGEDDDADDDSATLAHNASGGGYDSISGDVTVNTTDNDTRGLTLNPTSLGIAEGDSGSYTVVLKTQPTSTVTVAITGHASTDLTLAPSSASLTFTTSNWNTLQTVTVAAGEDDDADNESATLAHNASGGDYEGETADLAVTTTDNDSVGLVFNPTAVTVNEGSSSSYTVRLATEPTAEVTVAITQPANTELTLGTSSLTFSTSNWNAAQTVTVAAGEDDDSANDTATLTHTASGGDYEGQTADLPVTVTDDDTAPTGITLTASPNSVTEGGGAQSISVTAAIDGSIRFTEAKTVTVSVSDGTATSPADYAAVSQFSITINAGEASASHPFTLTPADDAAHEPTETINVTGTSTGLTVTADEISITDDDTAPPPPPTPERITLTASPDAVAEGGGAQSINVTATIDGSARFTAAQTVDVSVSDGTATAPADYAAVSGFSITIDAGDASASKAFTLTPVDDAAHESTETINVTGTSIVPVTPDEISITDNDDVPPPNFPPTVTAACDPCRVPRGGQVRLTATASDPDGDPLTYAWSAPAGRFDGPTDGPTARWTAPDKLGPVTIRVEVADGFGGFAMAEVTVNVINRMPVFEESVHRFNLPENRAGRPRPIELGTMTATDPDGDTLTYEQATGDRTRFAVRASGGIVTYIGPGEDFEVEPNRYLFAVRVEDAHGAVAVARVIVTVTDTNEQPVAHDDTAETREDEPVTVAVLANDTDPDGDDLRVATVSAPAHGDTAISADGGVSYRPRKNYHGADRFTYVVTDPDGETATATVEVTVRSVNDAPVAVGRIPDQALDEGGDGQDIDLAPFFDDIDGDALTYRAEVSDTDVATAAISGSLLTLTPVVYGSAAVTVTAEDDGGLTATQTFAVGVDDRLVRGVLDNTLAAMARSHLASARMTLGRRIKAGGSKRSRLTVAGQRVPLSKGAARQAADELALSWLSSAWGPGMSAHGLAAPGGPAGVAPAPGTHSVGGFGATLLGPAGGGGALPGTGGGLPGIGGFGGLGGLGSFGSFGGGSGALLRNSEFELALGGQDDGEGPAAPRWGVWGQGDIQTFRGTPDVFGYEADYAGDVQTGYVGVDARLTDRWLTGVAVARSAAGSDWQVGASSGQLKTTLTALHPYAEWSDGATSIWMMAGGGWGEAENVRDANGRLGTADLGLRLGLVDLRRRIGAAGGAEFALRADAAWAQLSTGDGGESVDSLAAAVNQQRVGGEVSGPFRLGGLTLAPFGEAHLRRDGGAGQNGTGMELGFGLRAQGGIVRIDAQGRVLAVHSAAGYRERGAGVTLTIGGQEREGLSLSVSPRWGDAGGGTGALWQDEVYRRYLPGAEQDEWAMDARGEYGMKLPSGQRLTWFGNFDRSRHGHRFLVGAQMGWLSDALLSRGSHYDSAVDDGDNIAGGNPPVPDR